jgi:predicted DNA-binding transcriptional regulator AlpA
MNLRPNHGTHDAHAQLVRQLCDALATFVAATASESGTLRRSAEHVAANDNDTRQRSTVGYHEIISLRGILLEFGLKQPEVLKLRKVHGFPEPIGPTRPLMFRRDEVETWVRARVRH